MSALASRTLAPRPPAKPSTPPPNWLAKDHEAERLLGTYHRDPEGVAWRVRALDTSDGGDIARLVRVGHPNHYLVQANGTERYRTVSVAKLDREYARMEISP